MSIERHYLRGIIHCHSNHSYDSATRISSYLKAAKQCELDFIILTDHDSVQGAQALQATAARLMPSLVVPLAAEYLTDEGDVIAAFIPDEIRARTFPQFVAEARQKDAMLLLPHPFVGHRSPERLAAECDLIETVNSRTSDSKNERATRLAALFGRPVYAASDAHFRWSIANAIVEVEDLGDLRESLLHGQIRWQSPRPTPRWEYGASQLVKSWKRRDARLALSLVKGGCLKLTMKLGRART